jgi:hypothetical protein
MSECTCLLLFGSYLSICDANNKDGDGFVITHGKANMKNKEVD